jgi:hypothetical protein
VSDPDALHYQSHKDDPEEWGEEEVVLDAAKSRRLDSVVSVRLWGTEEAALR